MMKPEESEIIRIFQNYFGRKSNFIPEDLEFLKVKKTVFVVKSDMLVQSTDVPRGMQLDDVARKSMVSCVSDFACKGIKPRYATISLALPKRFTYKMIVKLAKGFANASREFNVKIVGGDINEGKEVVIDVSMFGEGVVKVKRSGARNGDVIITSGPFGYASAGLKIITEHLEVNSKFARKCKKCVFRPLPRLKFGIDASKYFSSSMDSSDGLSITLNDMSALSNKKFIVTSLPVGEDLKDFARKNKLNLENLVFCGGEEYEIVATVPSGKLRAVKKLANKNRISLFEIGYVSKGRGATVADLKGEKLLKRCGWVHFRS